MEPALPVTPFWFKQRQCKMEPAGSDSTLKITAPNQREAYLAVRPVDGGFQAALRLDPQGDDLATSPTLPASHQAWSWAFELYRTHVVV
jgi:hypothetical protein